MFRTMTLSAILGSALLIGTTSLASAATYCAKYVGGAERMHSGARSQCNFSALHACRASVRARGGGSCYKRGNLR